MSVALVECWFNIGGAGVHTGTIPSKTLREAVLYLTGWRQRGFYGRNALDIEVTLVDGRNEVLGFLDREIVDEFIHHLRDRGVKLRLGETVQSVDVIDDKKLAVNLASGTRVGANRALFASGRQRNTDQLGVENAGVVPDERGRLLVDEHFRTSVPHIYTAGDVIGFPALASVSMEQGRQAGAHEIGRAHV